MKIPPVTGAYVGLGEGDSSDEIAKIKARLKKKYTPARNTLDDGPVFTPAMTTEVKREQAIFQTEGKLKAGNYIPGVINLDTKYAMGYLKRPDKPKPIVFTVEGHMSNMWIGPAAAIGEEMEAEGLAVHQPIGYLNTALPFKSDTGVDELTRFLNADRLDTGYPFPETLPWYLLGFSEGSIVTGRIWLHKLRPARAGTRLAKRRDMLRRAISFGDPYREKNVCAEWVPDPPKTDTQGISEERLDDTPSWWKPHSRTGDLYSENPDNEAGLYRTSIYKIAAEGSWSGGPAGMLARIMDLLTPTDDIIPVFKAIIGGVLFLGNMGPHGMYDLDPPTDYIRQGLLLDRAA